MKKSRFSLLGSVAFWLEVIFSVIYFIVAAGLIFTLSYFLGHPLLEGIMAGSDSSFALTVMTFLAKWFPRIPFWYPYQGAGQSMSLGYYALTYYIPIMLERLNTLSIVQSMRLVAFLTVPIIALELFVYCWLRLRNQMMGLMAGLLYPLSSAAWAWMTHGGFYAMSLSLVFIMPAFGFYDWFLDLYMRGDKSALKHRLALMASVIFVGLALASHLAVAATLLLAMGFYTIFRSQLNPLAISRKKSTFVALGILVFVVLLGVMFSAFAFFPQRHYTNQIAQDIIPVYGPDIPELKLSAFLGVDRFDPKFDSIYQPMFLWIGISIFGAVGIVLAAIKRHWIAGLGLTVLLLAYITSITKFINGLSHFWSVVMLPTNVRLAAFAFIAGPIVAAYGFWTLGELPFRLIQKALSLVGLKKNEVIRFLVFLGGSVLSLLIFVQVVYELRFYQRWSGGDWNQFAYSGFGPMGVIASFCMVPQLDMKPPLDYTCEDIAPKYRIDGIGRDPLPEMEFDEFAQRHGFDQFTRTDVSTHLGLLTATMNLHSEASMINSYNGIGALIYIWWGHEARVMFLPGDWTAEHVEEMAKYFGIRYIFLHGGDDFGVLDRYPTSTWKDVDALGGTILVKEYQDAPKLVSQFQKPTILVIGSRKKNAYEQIFRMAYGGGLSIEQGLIVQGKERIDDYSFEELSRFDVVVLHGYSYRNRNKAFLLLRRYVEEGGSVFVDTGWQYVARDWGKAVTVEKGIVYLMDLGDPFPVRGTTWGNIGVSWDGGEIDREIAPDVSLSSFAAPVWEDVPWGMAVAKRQDLAPWAKPLLALEDEVVIAGGSLGKGKVIWSGMNLFAYAIDKDSQEEYVFLRKLFEYLLPSKSDLDADIQLSRDYPDEIRFSFNKGVDEPSWLYFREAYSRDWRPRLRLADGTSAKVDFYKAGPGLMVLYLPPITEGSELTLTYSLGWLLPFSIVTTLLTGGFLLFALLEGTLGKRWLERLIFKKLERLRFKWPTIEHLIGHEDE